MPQGGIEKMPSTWITGQLTQLRNQSRNTLFCQDFLISPRIVNTMNKENRRTEKNTLFRQSTPFNSTTPGCGGAPSSPWKGGNWKKKQNTPLTRPEPWQLLLDRSHKHPAKRPIDTPLGYEREDITAQANRGGPCLSFPICTWGPAEKTSLLRGSHPESSVFRRSRRRRPRSHRSGALSGSPGWGVGGGCPGGGEARADVSGLSTPRAWPAPGQGN